MVVTSPEVTLFDYVIIRTGSGFYEFGIRNR